MNGLRFTAIPVPECPAWWEVTKIGDTKRQWLCLACGIMKEPG